MALDWPSIGLAQLESGQVRPVVLFRMATDPIIRLCSIVGEVEIPADLIEDVEDARYQGIGQLVGLPVVSELINGRAERVNFGLSGAGVTGEVAAIASTEAADIRGAAVNLGFTLFGRDWDRIAPVAWLWEGIADSLTVERQASGATVTRTVSISVGSVMTPRNRPVNAYFTDPDQKRRSADDRFFEQVRLYSVKTTKTWPA